MEKKMKDDIEKMRSEWKRPRKKRVDTHTVRRGMRNKRSERSKSARNTLDSFFSQATAGLEDEEMEEEKSLFSLQRSLLSLPVMLKAEKSETVRNRSCTRSTTNESVKEKYATEHDIIASDDPSKNKEEVSASGPTISYDEPDRRQSLMSMAALSFRGSIASLVEEEEDVPSKSFDRSLDSLRAKSLRSDFSPKKPSKTSTRTNAEHKKSQLICCEDPSKEHNEFQQKIHKEVEAWSALDLAPIFALGF
jgi:hypothetical protein